MCIYIHTYIYVYIYTYIYIYIYVYIYTYIGEGNGNPLQYFCLENPINSVERQKDMTLEEEPLRSEGIQYATGEKQRAMTNNCRQHEVAGIKFQK